MNEYFLLMDLITFRRLYAPNTNNLINQNGR